MIALDVPVEGIVRVDLEVRRKGPLPKGSEAAGEESGGEGIPRRPSATGETRASESAGKEAGEKDS